MMKLTRFAYFLRLLVGIYQRPILLLENKELLCFLHGVIAFFQMDSSYSNFSSGNLKLSAYHPSVWEIQRIAFTMIGEVYFRAGTSLTVDIWQSTIEVCVLVFNFFGASLRQSCKWIQSSLSFGLPKLKRVEFIRPRTFWAQLDLVEHKFLQLEHRIFIRSSQWVIYFLLLLEKPKLTKSQAIA